jgi:hypothetical protein
MQLESACLFCKNIFHYNPHQQTGKYCSNRCQQDYQMIQKINTRTASAGTVKGYLIKQYGAKCSLCDWDKLNSKTNKCPIELDHIDGDSKNNSLANCRLLCPNCHSLTENYKALNKGNGRHTRMNRYYSGKSY